MLPWKREDDYESGHPIKQNEFPAWCSNKEYLAYSSPSATFLGKGGLGKIPINRRILIERSSHFLRGEAKGGSENRL